LLIGDRRNRRLQTFALNDGRLLKTVKDADRLRLPCHFDSQGDWIVCADLESQVCILDRDYRVVAQLGDSSDPKRSSGQRRSTPRGDFPIGKFIAPHSAIFLKSGDILVAEWLPTGRITLLRKVS
jgi:hypothetical protein